MKSLNTETSHSTETVAVLALETVKVSRRAERSSVVDLGSDFSVLLGDLRRVGVDTENAGEGSLGLFVLSDGD